MRKPKWWELLILCLPSIAHAQGVGGGQDGTLADLAIAANNANAVTFTTLRKDVEALKKSTVYALKKYDAVYDNMTAQDVADYGDAKYKFGAQFVDAVGFQSEARVMMLRAGKNLEAARFAGTQAEANAYLNLSLKQSALAAKAMATAEQARSKSLPHIAKMLSILFAY